MFTKDVLSSKVQTQKDPQRRLVYKSIVQDLENGVAISKIAKDYNVTRQTVYRIKKEMDQLIV